MADIGTNGGKSMNENQQAIAAMRAITISREYGSGGGEIAAQKQKAERYRMSASDVDFHG